MCHLHNIIGIFGVSCPAYLFHTFFFFFFSFFLEEEEEEEKRSFLPLYIFCVIREEKRNWSWSTLHYNNRSVLL